MIGRQVGDYQIVQALGEGGMGMVFKGSHVHLGQIVAIKSLHSSLMNNQAAKDRFVREAQALARLNHPNIIGLKNFINDAAGCFIVMEYAEGEDLEQKLQRMGLIPPDQCIPWFIDACRGLDYAHKQNIIHRDIKPSNIIVHPSGTTKLLDFGTAKLVDAQRLTQQGMTLGTVIYMSKEQLLGKPLDARSDVYSLGVTLYECVTGKLPFYDEEERKLVVKIAKEQPIPPSQHYPGISPQLEQIILKSMSKDPAQRFQDATEMEKALAGLTAGPPVVTPTPTVTPVVHQNPVVTPTPTPTPVVTTTGGDAGGGGGGGNLLFSPFFLTGLIVCLLGVGIGLPVLGTDTSFMGGLILLIVGGVLGPVLMLLGYMRTSAQRKGGTTTAAVGAAPASSGNCPKCGRALLPGLPDCPFCNPQAPPSAAVQPQPAQPVPQAMPFNPGGTLNVNSANAAQKFAQPPKLAPAAAGNNGAQLQVIDGNDKGKQYQVEANNRFTIGRAPNCGACLNDPGVSGVHAALQFEGAGLFVEDAGSRNGVFVNNQKVKKQQVTSGDLIVIGSTRLLVNIG